MAPYVSVVINNYNYGRYLAQAIESALDQDFPPEQAEVVVVDDGSRDDSRKIIGAFSGRVRAIFQENQGQADALNAGIREAQGEILCFLDSDDWWRRDKLRRVVQRFEEDPSFGMVQHWHETVGVHGRPLPEWSPAAVPRYTAHDFLLGDAAFSTTSGMSFRRRVLERLLPIPKELRICADSYLLYAVLLAPVGNIPERLGFHRFHGENLYEQRHHDPRRLENSLQAISVCRRELEKKLAAQQAEVPERFRRRMRLEELEDRLFLSRYRAQWAPATRCWWDIARSLQGRRKVFKPARLLLALARPDLYLWLQGLYYGRPSSLERESLVAHGSAV